MGTASRQVQSEEAHPNNLGTDEVIGNPKSSINLLNSFQSAESPVGFTAKENASLESVIEFDNEVQSRHYSHRS